MTDITRPLVEQTVNSMQCLYTTTFFSCFNAEQAIQLWPLEVFMKQYFNAWWKYTSPDRHSEELSTELSSNVRKMIEYVNLS
jgi:hypothetical protein